MRPKFTIVIPSHKRPHEVLHAFASVQKQTYTDWKLYVVIDDTESDYTELMNESQKDNRVTVLRNESNLGKNRSINKILENLSSINFDGYVIYLDDDDWLARNCLTDFAKEISENLSLRWIVSNRVIEATGESLTKSSVNDEFINYLRENLIFKRITGDSTHCIHFPTTKSCRFSMEIRNGEEWVYFTQVAAIHPSFKYINSTGTYTNGYLESGLTANQTDIRSTKQIFLLIKEMSALKILTPYIYLYLTGRIGKNMFFKLNRLFYRFRERYFREETSQKSYPN